MSTLCMQTVVHGKTVRVMLSLERRTARIDIVDGEAGSAIDCAQRLRFQRKGCKAIGVETGTAV